MDGASVANRIEAVKLRVRNASARAGRKPEDVHVLAVSKFQSLNHVRNAFDEGLRDFAENYLQEALQKQEQLENLPVRWHFIGRVQSNKIKSLVGRFAAIHSVDRLSTLQALEKNCVAKACRQDVFLQLNLANEDAKGGAKGEEIQALVEGLRECRQVRALGLMIMPPFAENSEEVRPYFREARLLLSELRESLDSETRAHHPLNELSMGTSQDFEVAIEEGATWVRIGTDIFGPREEPT